MASEPSPLAVAAAEAESGRRFAAARSMFNVLQQVATVHVAELGLCDTIIHVDDGKDELTAGDHLLQLEDTCDGCLTDTRAVLCHSHPLGIIQRNRILNHYKTQLNSGFCGVFRN